LSPAAGKARLTKRLAFGRLKHMPFAAELPFVEAV
jgi:hypothetical protein